jgi:hypothetical protein
MTNQREMESTRITVARALELGVRLSWREATAIVQEAIARAAPTEGVGPARVTIDDCVLTRGGDVMLTGTAAWARPEAVVPLLDDLLARCSDPGRFAGAVADGTALEMLAELTQHTTAKRRRVEVASVALRGLAAAAEAARAMADAAEQPSSAQVGGVVAAAATVAAPTAAGRPWPPASLPASTVGFVEVRRRRLDHASVRATVADNRAADNVRGRVPARPDWVQRARPAALVVAVIAVATSVILALRTPAIERSPAVPSEPVIERPQSDAPVDLDGHTPVAADPAPLPEVADAPSVVSVMGTDAPSDSTPPSVVIPPPLVGLETLAESTLRATGSPSTTAAAPLLTPDVMNLSALIPSQTVDPSFEVASPAAAASLPAASGSSGAASVPANAVTPPPGVDAEARAIETVLGRYRVAFSNLDAGAASAVWPTVDEKTLAKAFERLESHDVSFENCQIEVFSGLAEAACSGNARYVPKVGSRTPKDEARRWRFSLRKAGGEWLIDQVDAR